MIESTVTAVKVGNNLTQATRQAFDKNIEIIAKVGEIVAEIAAASGEQAQGIDQINKAVGNMDKVVQQVAASSEESASAAEELSAQSEQMKAVVNQLKSIIGGNSTPSPTTGAGGQQAKLGGKSKGRVPGNSFEQAPGKKNAASKQASPFVNEESLQEF